MIQVGSIEVRHFDVSAIIRIAEQYGFSFHEYDEDGVVCGYEMETWTDGGVDMIHFIDCRCEDGITPETVISELEAIYEDFDVDEEIDVHRQGEDYRNAFTIRQSVHDFEKHEQRLRKLVDAVKEKYEERLVIHRAAYGQGHIFKDEDAYLHNPEKPCYVSELSDDIYTAKDFLVIADWDQALANLMFYSIDWQSPWTWIDEYRREERDE